MMIYDHGSNYLIVACSSNLIYSHPISYGNPKVDQKGVEISDLTCMVINNAFIKTK